MSVRVIRRLLPRPAPDSGVRRLLQRIKNPVWMGNLRRKAPVTSWGWERGTPIDRYYIECFLESCRDDIRGRVLEVRDSGYATRFGVQGAQVDVLDIDSENPAATIVADLCAADDVPAAMFDCFILTQTLQYIYDFNAAVGHAFRILKPGGVLLVTAPTVQRIDIPNRDLWRFTPEACALLFGRRFGQEHVRVESYGNAVASIAFLSGLAAEEFKNSELAANDPNYVVITTVRAQKPRR